MRMVLLRSVFMLTLLLLVVACAARTPTLPVSATPTPTFAPTPTPTPAPAPTLAPAPAAIPVSIVWPRQFGTPDEDRAQGVVVDSGGNIYIVGDTLGGLPGQASAGSYDAFVRRYDPDGKEEWTRPVGTTDVD